MLLARWTREWCEVWVIEELCFRSMLVCSPLPPSWPVNPVSKLTK